MDLDNAGLDFSSDGEKSVGGERRFGVILFVMCVASPEIIDVKSQAFMNKAPAEYRTPLSRTVPCG
jgi:hypothetical protein